MPATEKQLRNILRRLAKRTLEYVGTDEIPKYMDSDREVQTLACKAMTLLNKK